MRLKQRREDFRVRELLHPEFLKPEGEFRIYRVIKRKLTTFEAVGALAKEAGVPPSEISLAGLKDRQGITLQHMSVRRGRAVSLRSEELSIETAGFSQLELTSEASLGNAFEIAVRGLEQEELNILRANVPLLREQGLVNYFDEQRFGNLRYNQGWIAQLLMRGQYEEALKKLLASLSDHDDARNFGFKTALLRSWGDWQACREIAGRFGEHHSVFEYLKKNDGDFAGAFFHVATRVRLIHLYAFQSHVWNRAVADLVRERVPAQERITLEGIEGALLYPSRPLALDPSFQNRFRIPGPRLEDVTHPEQRALLENVLARERTVASQFRIEGVSGFQLKGEDRELFVHPRHLRVRPAERDALNRGFFMVKVRFELPRGAYASLVVRRLLSSPLRAAGRSGGPPAHEDERRPARRDARADDRRDDRRGDRRDDRRGDRGRGYQGASRGPAPYPREDRARPTFGGPASDRGARGRGGPYGGPPRPTGRDRRGRDSGGSSRPRKGRSAEEERKPKLPPPPSPPAAE
jgi:tRNA pseudouridine13 synthase